MKAPLPNQNPVLPSKSTSAVSAEGRTTQRPLAFKNSGPAKPEDRPDMRQLECKDTLPEFTGTGQMWKMFDSWL